MKRIRDQNPVAYETSVRSTEETLVEDPTNFWSFANIKHLNSHLIGSVNCKRISYVFQVISIAHLKFIIQIIQIKQIT